MNKINITNINFKKIIIMITLIFLININITNISALEIMEPVVQELNTTNQVDIGYVSPNERFLISFLVNTEKYTTIEIENESKNIALLENTKATKESIFTTVKLNENIEGNQKLKLILKSENKNKEIILNLNVTNDVIYSQVLPYNKNIKINENKTLKIKIFNKAQSTKKITITSNLNDYWFNNLKKNKEIILQPNSTQIIDYTIKPPIIGNTNFEIYIFKNYNKKEEFYKNLINTNNYKIENIEVNIIKDLNSIYGTKKHQFPLFGLNTLPIYFFNNIIKLL